MTRVYAAFVGCKVSQADSETALAQLAAAGLEPTASREEADVCLLMTCGVTAEAERKSRRLARRLAQDGRRVFVAGCAATLRAAQFEHPGVEVVDAEDLIGLADRIVSSATGVSDRRAATDPETGTAVPAPRGRTRFTLKVQDGCDGACSYCVVRLVRGRPRSAPLARVVAAARDALAEGCGEVVLSGIDLGAYRDAEGVGTAPGGVADLADLVRALVHLPGLLRLRLSSLEPHHIDDRLLEELAHPRVARHLHVPLQSADDDVLRTMGRRYTVAQYLDVAERVRSRLGDAMLSTDVIVGFPTEDEAAYARTQAVLESGLFGRAHVFAYSSRPGTAAADLYQLPPAVVRTRAAAAGVTAREAQRRAATDALGRRAEVLIEERRDGHWRGYSSQYVRYYLSGPAQPGRLVDAVAEGLHGDGVRGRVEDAPGRGATDDDE
jgi:threonylcarbamoyladenosine tRNA methylthiotransferase MtaB